MIITTTVVIVVLVAVLATIAYLDRVGIYIAYQRDVARRAGKRADAAKAAGDKPAQEKALVEMQDAARKAQRATNTGCLPIRKA